jgi:subtilisin family serine protease
MDYEKLSKRTIQAGMVTVFTLSIGIASHAMNLVREETRTEEAVVKYGVTGQGVTIAILDRGIDWRHPDFIKPDGTTRIKWLLDMTGQNGCDASGKGSPPPVEYSEAQINAALEGGPAINSRDAEGHGTLTAGIAAGNGRAFAAGKYRGIAPEADLIIVKATSEGAPAHDGEPEEAPFNACFLEALDWLDGKVRLLGQPVVATINAGVQLFGPVDGTSVISRKIDQVFGQNRPGRVYVSPSGDEGSLPNHAGGSYSHLRDTVVRFNKASDNTSDLALWYTGSKPAEVTLTFEDGTVFGPIGPGEFVDQPNDIFFAQYEPGQEFYPATSTSGDRLVFARITGHNGAGTLRIRGLASGRGRFDLYGDVLGPNLTPIISFIDGLVPGRLTDFSSTRSAVVVGAHVVRTSYVDINHVTRDVSDEGEVGELWLKSSGGPTRDRRLGMDLTAPGHNLFASYAPQSFRATFRFNLIEDGGGFYGRQGATSGSGPIVVGAIALLLQMKPTLTARQAELILHNTAVADAFTGRTPNRDWGFGKLDVLAALKKLCHIQPRCAHQPEGHDIE